jgi:hypothetical protein
MKNYFYAVDPVLTSHFSDRNDPSPFYHFFTSAVLRYPKYPSGIGDGIALFYENLYFISKLWAKTNRWQSSLIIYKKRTSFEKIPLDFLCRKYIDTIGLAVYPEICFYT